MKKFYLLLCCFCTVISNAQIPAMAWKKCYGGTKSDALQSIKATADGGYIMAGTTYSSDGDVTFIHGGSNDTDIWVVKVDNNGTIEWQKSYGGTQMDFSSDIELTPDGGYIIAGRTYSTNGDSTAANGLDAWILKIAADGTLQWQKTYGGNGADAAFHIQPTADGGYVFSGFAGGSGGIVTNFHGMRDGWIVKITADGTLQWQKTLGGTNEDYAYKILPVSDGYVIGCDTYSYNGDVTANHGFIDMWVVKLDTSGAMVWNKCYGSNQREELNDIIATPDGGFILAGNASGNGGDVTGYHSPGTGNFGIKDDYWIVKTDGAGMIQWQKCYGGSDNDVATKIANTPEGGYIITGYSDSNSGDNDSFFTFNHLDYWVVKINNAGTIQWQETYGGSLDDSATDLLVTADGGYMLGGFVSSTDQLVTNNHGGNDYFIVKLQPDTLANSGFETGSDAVFPNPVTAVLNVQSETEFDSIGLYDLQGRKIMESGAKAIDVSAIAPGTYIVTAFRGTKALFTRKIVKK